MRRSPSATPLAFLLAAALACQGASDGGRDADHRVVVRSSTPVQPPGEAVRGQALGPSDRAPEVVVLSDPAPREPAVTRPVREPDPGPRSIVRTVYVYEEAPAAEPAPVPAPVDAPVEVASEPVEPVEPAPPVAPEPTEPVWTEGPPAPDDGPNRVRDAAVGAAIGAGIGAVLGGSDGAVRGGIGGAVGGAIGGTTGAILGGVLGGGSQSRGRIPRRGGGCDLVPRFAPGPAIHDVNPRPLRPGVTLTAR